MNIFLGDKELKVCTSDELKKMELFKNINELSAKKLSDIARIKTFKKGEHIFRDKEEVKYVYIVLTGKVSLYKLSESAQKKVVFIFGENKLINAAILDSLPASINCEVFENTDVLYFDRESFVNIMKEDFELTKIIIDSLATKVRRLYRQSKNSIPIKVEKKLAAKLWKLSKDYGVDVEEGILIDLNITVTYLAEMFGMPRETISRAIKILVKEGLIINKNRKIIINDREKLAKFFKES